MKKILSLITGLALLCPIFTVVAQSERINNVPLSEEYVTTADYAFTSLDKNFVSTGILYDRVFKTSRLEAFQSSEYSNAGHWLQAYYELYQASYDRNNLLSQDDMDNLIYENTRGASVPLGVIFANFNTLNSDAVDLQANGQYQLKNGYNASQLFSGRESVVASSLVPSIPKGTTGFSLPRWATFSCGSVYVTSISVDFGDGNPIRSFTPGGLFQSATYNSEGEKSLIFTIHLSNGAQRTARAKINVTQQQRPGSIYSRTAAYPRNDNISRVDSADVWATVPFQGYEENSASLGYGQYLTYYAQGRTQLRKPIVIIDGFDPLEERFSQTIYERRLRYNDSGLDKLLGDDLRHNTSGNGYDVIILNAPKYEYTAYQRTICDPRSNRCFTQNVKAYRVGGADYIERNGLVLVELIKRVNQQLQANGSNEKITVIGPSMGGLVSRYALRYMEQNGMNANCKLWISFDSPHHGATVPLGLQFFLRLTEDISAGSKTALRDQLNVPAARQMLIQHYKGRNGEYVSGAPGFRDRFVQTMNNMGFPQASCMRKVALNNGSKAGIFQNGSACSDAMRVKAEFGPGAAPLSCAPIGIFTGLFWLAKKQCGIPVLETHAYTAPNNNDRCKIASREILGFNGDKGEVFIRGNDQPSSDLLPGGNKNFLGIIAEQAKFYNWFFKTNADIYFPTGSFIPSVSSYALKNTNRNWGASLNTISIQTDTPFDALYAPDNNEEHTEVTKAGVDFIKQQLAIADQQCVASLPLSNGCYTIKAKHSNKFIQPENNNSGARIRQYGGNGQSNQIFQLEVVDGNAYKLTSKSSNKVWEASGNGTVNGTAISQGDWNGGNHQKWSINPWGDGTYKIEGRNAPGQLADVEGGSGNDGAGLLLWGSHSGDNQRYYFATASCDANVSQGTGTGLTGSYFNNTALSGTPVMSRTDETINYPWAYGGPGNGVGIDNFSVRWEGQIEFPVSTVKFKTFTDDGIRLWVNGHSVINQWVNQSPTWHEGTITLTAGQKYNIKMEYFEGGGEARAELHWEYSGQSQQIVPKQRLYPLGGCTTPSVPGASANPSSINSGSTSQLSATCDGGASLSWSHGLSGSPVNVTPGSTTTYTATCTLNGCSNSANVTVTVTNPPSGDCYELRLASNGRRVTNVGGIVKVKFPPASGNNQTWKLEPDGSHYKIIVQDGTSRVLGVESGGNSIGNIITLQNFNGQDHQLWTKQQISDGGPLDRYGFVRKNSSLIIHSEPNWGDGDANNAVTDLKLTDGSDLNVYGRNKFYTDTKTCPTLRMGVEEAQAENNPEALTVSPNPNAGEFEAGFYLGVGKAATLSVINILGQTLYERGITGQGTHTEKVKLGSYVPGIFLVQLRSGKSVEVKKIIVVR